MATPTRKPVTPNFEAMAVLKAGAVAGFGSCGPPLLLELDELELELELELEEPEPLELPPELEPPLLLPEPASLPPQADSASRSVEINAADSIFMGSSSLFAVREFLTAVVW
jgi:hypothetical protein